MKRILTLNVLLILLILGLIGIKCYLVTDVKAAPGVTLYVGGTGPGNYTSIQAAIDDASSGDTIFIYNGTYYENLYINKSINLVGESINGVIINGSGAGDVILINETSWVNMSDFTVTYGGSLSGNAGIRVYHSTHVSIKNLNISENEIGIRIEYSSHNIISNNLVTGNRNKALLFTGANIPTYYSNNNTVSNNIISNNLGGGIYLESYCENNLIINNTCTHNGYDGIQIIGAGVTQRNTVDKNNFSNNARYGIYLLSNNNIVTNNTCNYNGLYGIYFEGADYNYLNNNSFSHNQYGIYINTNSNNNNISNVICYGNTKAAIYLRDTLDNIIWKSICSSSPYGIFIENSTNTTILYSTIVSNTEGVCISGDISSGIYIHYCNISHNTIYGVNNSATIVVDAEHNWWGDSSGPYDPSNDTLTGGLYNPSGKGDNVTDYVDYYPWWDSPAGAIPPEIVDNTPGVATTGDAFTFNASVTDSVGVAGVYVEYWYDAG
ncbi:MAG: right-handed parallel beta-helix repeat-containing protein, partial [Thermoplasmata archaeon]|nr:right-handed parallel beta-helix repeat-containing protein [Thermoplasmata archaeon]